jgi:hypothetical protein
VKRLFPVLPFLLLSAAWATPVCGSPYRIVSFDRSSVTVEFTISQPKIVPAGEVGGKRLSRIAVDDFYPLEIEGKPILPVRRFLFEVPSPSGVVLDILDEESRFVDGVLPAVSRANGPSADEGAVLAQQPPLGEQRFARLSGVERIRGRFCALVDLHPVLFDPQGERLKCARRILVRLSFPPAEERLAAARRSPVFDDLIVNADQAASWDRSARASSALARTPFEFARSSNWVRIRIKEKGLYMITYNDLLTAGAYPATIDPGSLRLFSSDPVPEPDSLQSGGSFRDDYHFTEQAILYRGSSAATGSFQPGDTILFYGLGVTGWANDLDPAADGRKYYKHPYATENVYWLTWGGDFSGAPRRMAERSVAPQESPPVDTTVSWYEERIHNESDVLYDAYYADDRWYWTLLQPGGSSQFSNDFYLDDVADGNGALKTKAYGPYDAASIQNSAVYRINGVTAGTLSWIVIPGYNPGSMKTLEAPVSNLVDGRNTFVASKPLNNEMYFFWYEIFYRRRLRAHQNALDFHAPRGSKRARFTLGGFASGERFLFDVSQGESPVLCTGWRPETDGLTFDDELDLPARHYVAVSRSALRRFSGAEKSGTLALVSVPSLRDEGSCPNMVIIYHERFQAAALMLRRHRDRGLPGIEHPVVRAIDIEDVYANFSGGRKDPIAIRNYLKFLYDQSTCSSGGEPSLAYVLLVGNGTYDQRDVLKQGNDLIPLYINVHYGNETEGVEDDDFLVKLDEKGVGAPDLAIGRMTVVTAQEANAWAQRIVDYEETPEFGPWRDKVILVADDEHSTSTQSDYEFQDFTEELAMDSGPFPRALDLKKIYLHVYPFLGDVKPAARKDLINEWNEGVLIMNYNGHGSPLQMADERVMVDSDIYSLSNGLRRPMMLSFSCSVGDLESPYHRSMAQNMVTYDKGGAIGTIAAAAPTYFYPNSLLNKLFYGEVFVSKDSTGTRPIGVALERAKYLVVSREGYESHNGKYILLGDPAMRLAMPALRIEHDISTIDTMHTGQRCVVSGSVTAGGAVLGSFNGVADVTVEEAEQEFREPIGPRDTLAYSLPGKELYRGTVNVTGGRFTVEFVVPKRCHTGPNARIRSYATTSLIDAVGACDTLRIVQADTMRRDLEPPRVHLYFAGQATKVKAGAKLVADISDPDGIAILGTDPQSSIFLEFDGSGYPVYVTDYFTYDHGSYTSGKVEYPLSSGFAPGPHSVLIKAFDNLGLSAADTLRFDIVEGGLFQVSDVFNFPNPFSLNTNFVFQVTNRAEATLSIYTVSGLKIWERRLSAAEGFNSINWDGRDVAGDRIANGTYLYVLDVDFKDSYHRTESVTGKVVYMR